MARNNSLATRPEIRLHRPEAITDRLLGDEGGPGEPGCESPSHDLRWLLVLRDGLGHAPYLLQATDDGRTVGVLSLCLVRSLLFGRFLVSLPYLNSGGVACRDGRVAAALIDRAVTLADELDVRHLELRHEAEQAHPMLTQVLRSKVHMRLRLPSTGDELWKGFKSKLRSQVKKGGDAGFEVSWGGASLLAEFYAVFSRNMRDLGTPVFGKSLFASILKHFPDTAEFCIVRLGGRPVAAALLIHGKQVTEVPSASSLREHNGTNANMYMYWQLLQRAIERGNAVFDFGRSSQGSGTYRFKAQWGAQPEPAVWQYYVRRGEIGGMRPENTRYQRAIRLWQRLPVAVTRWIGPAVVRGIP